MLDNIFEVLWLTGFVAGLSFLVTQIPLFMIRVPREEKMMLKCFGEEYREYMNRTGRFIPSLPGR